MSSTKQMMIFTFICVIYAKEHLRDVYTIDEMLFLDFPDPRSIFTKTQLLDFFLRRFVHSNLKHARYAHFKSKNSNTKVKHYNDKELKNDPEYEQKMKNETIKELEKEIDDGRKLIY